MRAPALELRPEGNIIKGFSRTIIKIEYMLTHIRDSLVSSLRCIAQNPDHWNISCSKLR